MSDVDDDLLRALREGIIGPPPKRKPVHMAKMVNKAGGVSPLCASRPRAIDLKRATWTNRAEAVTCERCLKALTPTPNKEREEK